MNRVYKLAAENGFFCLSDTNQCNLFSRRDLDGNELKKLLPGLFSNLVSLQTLWVNDAFLQVLFYKHNMATFHDNDSLRFAQETYMS